MTCANYGTAIVCTAASVTDPGVRRIWGRVRGGRVLHCWAEGGWLPGYSACNDTVGSRDVGYLWHEADDSYRRCAGCCAALGVTDGWGEPK